MPSRQISLHDVHRAAGSGAPFRMHGPIAPARSPGGDDSTALSTLLGGRRYFFGETPTEIDATAYGFLAQVLWAPGARRMRRPREETRNLPAFCERIEREFYGGPTA